MGGGASSSRPLTKRFPKPCNASRSVTSSVVQRGCKGHPLLIPIGAPYWFNLSGPSILARCLLGPSSTKMLEETCPKCPPPVVWPRPGAFFSGGDPSRGERFCTDCRRQLAQRPTVAGLFLIFVVYYRDTRTEVPFTIASPGRVATTGAPFWRAKRRLAAPGAKLAKNVTAPIIRMAGSSTFGSSTSTSMMAGRPLLAM